MTGSRDRCVVNLDQHCSQRDRQLREGVTFGGDRGVNQLRILLRIGGANFEGDREVNGPKNMWFSPC